MTDPKDATIKELLLKELEDHSTEKWKYKAECSALENSLREACAALEEVYMCLADCMSRVKAPDAWMFEKPQATLTKLRERHEFLRGNDEP